MDYFTAPSEAAYVLLFAGLMSGILSVVLTAANLPGSPIGVQDRLSHRIASLTCAALLMAGAVPLLWAPVVSALGAR